MTAADDTSTLDRAIYRKHAQMNVLRQMADRADAQKRTAALSEALRAGHDALASQVASLQRERARQARGARLVQMMEVGA